MNDTLVVEHVRRFVAESFLYRHPGLQVSDDDNLLELGVIDSLGVVELITEVEQEYEISVQDLDVTEENFGSVTRVAEYVRRRAAEG
jgi:acyl carrier protein